MYEREYKMKIIVILLSTLIFFSCQKAVNDNDIKFKKFFSENLIYSQKINLFHENGKVITDPVGVKNLVFESFSYSQDSTKIEKYCIFYKTPFRQKMGEVEVVKIQENDNCRNHLATQGIVKLEFVTDLSVFLNNDEFKINFIYNGKYIDMRTDLLNLESKVIHEKFLPESSKSKFKNINIVRIEDETFSMKNDYLGELNDSFSLNSAIRCQEINKDCSIIGENICDRCRYGSYDVVTYNCSEISTRFCGISRCGQKNEPACPKGSGLKGDFAICNLELTPVMSADGVWICQ